MIIAGHNTLSLSDYPGVPAVVLFTQGCNFACPFCHNSQLLPPMVPVDDAVDPTGDLLNWLDVRFQERGAKGVVVTGGEPTLHKDLPEFLAALKRIGYKVKLDTNGSKPEMVHKVISKGLVDFIAMDVKAPWEKYNELCGKEVITYNIQWSIDLIAESGIAHQFRTTWVKQLLTKADIIAIHKSLPKGSPYKINKFIAKNSMDRFLKE